MHPPHPHRRGNPCGCPCRGPDGGLGDNDDSVHVVGHNHKRIQINRGETTWQRLPFRQRHPTGVVQPHLAVHHLTEYMLAVLRAYGHKIRTDAGIIPGMERRWCRSGLYLVFFVRHLPLGWSYRPPPAPAGSAVSPPAQLPFRPQTGFSCHLAMRRTNSASMPRK